MANNKQMESKVYNLVSCLADNFGFDADAAFEYARWETDVDHVGELLKMLNPINEKINEKIEVKKKVEISDDKDDATVSSSGDAADKIAACKKNIATWEKKLADGKVKDVDKQADKIAKEKAKLAKLEAKSPSSVKEEPKKKVEVSETKEKRIKRMSPVMTGQLKKALEDVGLEFSDKLKKEFVQYVDDLTDDDFKKVGLADHMREFSNLKAPTKPVPIEEELDDEEDEQVPIPEQPTSNVAGGGPGTVTLKLNELQAIEMTAAVEPVGTFWDADNGRFVKGPEEDADEDMEEITFEGKTYAVGEKTGRVYEARETGDFFAGFIGVGKFKAMKKTE